MKAYVIGDIHGQIDLLIAAHELIVQDSQKYGFSPVVHVGDIVDRGPETASTIEYLRLGIEQGEDWIVLKGNHDRMFYNFMQTGDITDPCLTPSLNWLNPRLGGGSTLASYGVETDAGLPTKALHDQALELVPKEHITFLSTRPSWLRMEDVIFVHAGIRPMVPMNEQSENDLLWIRNGFLDYTKPHEALIVHGHTAVKVPTHYGNRVNIDTGVAYGGRLSVIVIDDGAVFWLTGGGRIPLIPD